MMKYKHRYVKNNVDSEAFKEAEELKIESSTWHEWFDDRAWTLTTGVDMVSSVNDYQSFMKNKFL